MSENRQIVVQHLAFGYDKKKMFHFPSLLLNQGEHCLILGNSGSGKTTFIHLLSGLLQPLGGRVMLYGVRIHQLSSRRLDLFRGQHIGLIFQQAHLMKSLTVLENLQLAQELAGLKKDSIYQQLILQRLDILEKKHSYPHQLSQGQLQRAAIARAVINRPKLLIADEPTSALDDINAERVLDLLIDQAAINNASLMIATHDQRVKNRIANTYQL